MRQNYNVCVLSYSDVDEFFNIAGCATAETPEFPAGRAIFRACRLERMPEGTAMELKATLDPSGIHAIVFPLASENGDHVADVVLLGTMDAYEVALGGLFVSGDPDLADAATQITEALTAYESNLGKTICGTTEFLWGTRTYIMGIVNATPDSFSGDGITDPEVAVKHALKLVEEGADIIDVGGESTRPPSTYSGAQPTDESTELARVMPVLRLLVSEFKSRGINVPISIDSYKARVAAAALEAGASIINDVWSLLADPNMARVAAESKAPIILMHNQHEAKYNNLMADIIRQLRHSMRIAIEAGVKMENIIIDPGIGFGKKREHNLETLNRLDELKVLGRPILLGTSRKAIIGQTLKLPPDQRIEGTAATVSLGIAKGADIVRVHDVMQIARAVRVTDAIVRRQW